MKISDFLGGAHIGWLIFAAVLSVSLAGTAGMYGGYEIASARYERQQVALKDAQITALGLAKDSLAAEQARGQKIAGEFLTALQNIKVENKTFNTEITKEVATLPVYTECIVPESGVALLNGYVDVANGQTATVKKESK